MTTDDLYTFACGFSFLAVLVHTAATHFSNPPARFLVPMCPPTQPLPFCDRKARSCVPQYAGTSIDLLGLGCHAPCLGRTHQLLYPIHTPPIQTPPMEAWRRLCLPLSGTVRSSGSVDSLATNRPVLLPCLSTVTRRCLRQNDSAPTSAVRFLDMMRRAVSAGFRRDSLTSRNDQLRWTFRTKLPKMMRLYKIECLADSYCQSLISSDLDWRAMKNN
jgi:hypothetical protein